MSHRSKRCRRVWTIDYLYKRGIAFVLAVVLLLNPAILNQVAFSTTDYEMDDATYTSMTLSEEILNEGTTDEEVDSEEPVDEEVDSEEPVDEEVDSEEPVDEEVDSEESVDEEVDSEESVDEEVDSEEPVDEDADNEESLDEELENEDTEDEDDLEEDALEEDTETQDIPTEDTSEEETVTQDPSTEDTTNEGDLPADTASSDSVTMGSLEEEETTVFEQLFDEETVTALTPAMNEDFTLGIDNSIALTSLSMPMNEVMTTLANELSVETGYGNFSVTTPTNSTGATYTVKITLNRTTQGDNFISLDNTEKYLITATYADGTTEEKAIALDPAGWPNLAGQVASIPAGTTLLFKDILVMTGDGTTWGDYVETFVFMEVISTDSVESVVLTEASQSLAYNDGTTIFAVDGEAGPVQNNTEDTFLTLGGEYTLLYLLNNYNVVSLKDIESTHIVGPIISQEGAYRTGDAYNGADHDGSDLVASDYSRGVSSYVGKLYTLDGDVNSSALQLGYGFDDDDASFIPPDFYTRENEIDGDGIISITEITENWQKMEYVMLTRNGGSFLSPNSHGEVSNYDQWGTLQSEETHTYQNDDFINFDKLWENIEAESYALMENGTLEGNTDVTVINSAGTSLEIEAGNSYLIMDATYLEEVNIILPDDYDFFVNPYLPPTTISFAGSTINPAIYDGLAVSQFPVTLINGVQLDAMDGENGEYSEVGNKIIWNLPNVVTTGTHNRLVTYGEGVNIAGHIVAVNAEFWNINEEGSWEGGNLNGTAVVADFHSGNMEMHMWAYGGLLEQATYVQVEVEKIFENGDPANQSFQFILTSETLDSDGNPETTLYATTNELGMAYFSSLVFDTAGTYTYYVEEDIPEDTGSITYDTSRYRVVIEVDVSSGVDSSGYSYINYSSDVIYAIEEGSDNWTEVDGLSFTNTQDLLGDAMVSYSFTKTDSSGYPLSGAVFLVITEVDPSTSDTAWDNSTDSQSSGTGGVVTFDNLEAGKTYYFKETVAPSGYDIPEGYWSMTVDSYGVITVAAVGDAPEIIDKELVNYRTENTYVSITLTKENEHGRALPEAEFLVQQAYSIENHVIVEGGYTSSYISDQYGNITIADLQVGYVYRVTEVVAPEGYMLPFDIDYWIIEVTSDSSDIGYTTTLYSVDEGVLTVLSDEYILTNWNVYILPTTGGTYTAPHYIVSLALMMSAGIYATKYFKKEKWREKT